MKRRLIALTLAAVLGAAGAAEPAGDALFHALGGRAGLERLAADFVDRANADARVGPAFDGVNRKHLSRQIADHFCQLTGGPCVYDGGNMKDAHGETRIDKGDFYRVVELLQDAMDHQGLPFAVQNRLLALLAPMHRDIINAP